MMTSELSYAEQAFVWVWLPNASEPVVAGRIHKQGNLHYFTYGRSLSLCNWRQRLGWMLLTAFWDGQDLTLTPAYDLCPQMRSGREAAQAMQIGGVQGNLSTLVNVFSACGTFMLSEAEARGLIERQVAVIEDNWVEICNLAELGAMERERLWGRAVFNPFCFEGWN